MSNILPEDVKLMADKKVMAQFDGWTNVVTTPEGFVIGLPPEGGINFYAVPDYPKDMNALWDVIVKLIEHHQFTFDIGSVPGTTGTISFREFNPDTNEKENEVQCHSKAFSKILFRELVEAIKQIKP